ncbi:3-isopropylmalate dehydrogenase leu2a [Xylaria flabelliformis]|nr:3-isopropylmalate dehydrogenase leu2a [Xylaria flabelliformis]
MTADRPPTSSGDLDTFPPTPSETPTSAHFPQSILKTPETSQGHFDDRSGWTPQFAEEYSVFNTTPGNLRGLSGPSVSTPYQPPSGHKRLLSVGSVPVEIASHAQHYSPISALPLPPVDPSRRLPSSPAAGHPFPSPIEADCLNSLQPRSGKKVRRGTLADTSAQTITPPPSARKGERRLAPKPQAGSMQHDEFESEFVAAAPQQQHMLGGLAGAPIDMFAMPLSAPATAPVFDDPQTFWDPGMSGMDIDFSMPVADSFHGSNHRPMSSLDWGKTNEMFQEPNTSMTEASVFAHSFHIPTDEPFVPLNPIGGVDPGLLFTRPPSSSMELAAFDPMQQHILMNSLPSPQLPAAPLKEPKRGQIRRAASTREIDMARKDERAPISPPIFSSSRPGLLRSASETRGRKPANRPGALHSLVPAARNGSLATNGRSASQGSRTSGRTSPLKIHQRLSSLSSIPEHSGPRTRRARAETTRTPSSRRRRREERREWESSADESSSTDEEPIIIPTSEAPSSFSDQSTSSLGIYYNEPSSSQGDAETVNSNSRGDALSELRKVRENRQKRVTALNTSNHSISSTSFGAGPLIPTPSTNRGNQIQCVCNTTLSHIDGDGYMVQCESCEMWLHGKCVNITRQTLPRVYICAFCANTPNAQGVRGRGVQRGVGGPAPRTLATTPLANKSIRSFRKQSANYHSILEISRPLTSPTMASFNIVVFGGDHSGPEVVAEAVKVLKAVESNSSAGVKFNLQDHLLGGCSIDAHGTPLTDAALEAAKAADAVLLGAIGGPKWGTGAVRPEQGILKLRKEMGTYGNLRPCFFPSQSLVEYSPLKAEVCRDTDFTIVRELTGGIYFGERKEDEGDGTAFDTEPYSRPEIERITRLAAHLALARNPPAPVWSLDKANVLATSRLWRKVVTEVMQKEFPQLQLHHQLIDSAAMIMVKNPRGLNGVVVTSNLFGDIISDEASVIPGSIGLSPSASLSGIPDGKNRCNGIYEPIHGSAPDISGQGIANPIGTILSVAMMCRYSLRLPKEADAIEKAVRNVLDGGVRTKDMGGDSGTKATGDAIVAELIKILKA